LQRDGAVAFVPPAANLDETWTYLREAGFAALEDTG
jgi:hypothetical protein